MTKSAEIKNSIACRVRAQRSFPAKREPGPGFLSYCLKLGTKIQKILFRATFRTMLTPLI